MTDKAIIDALITSRKSLQKLAEYPGTAPTTIAQAVALQDGVIAGYGEPVGGWKIGATNPKSQILLKTDEPFFGAIFGSRIFKSKAKVKIAPHSLAIIEPEIAFLLARDIPPRTTSYSAEEVFACVASVHPALELIDRRLPGTVTDGILWHIADCGLNDAFVYGPGDAHIKLDQLADIAVSASLNGEAVATGVGANALGGAHLSAQWLANCFSQLGRTLKAGQFLTTGLTTQVFTMAPGDTVEADFGALGSVSVTIG